VVQPAPTPQTVYAKEGDQVSVIDGVNTIYLLGSNGSITAQAGTNTLYTNGSNNALTGGKGNDVIQAFGSNNVLNGGAGSDTFQFAGSNNIIYTGNGADTIRDSGINNRIVFGKAGEGTTDIYGYVLTNNDVLDLRNTLAATTWTKDPATLANYLKITMSGNSAVLSVDADGLGAGVATKLATLQNSGNVSMSTLLAHSLVA
jgi:Ca2+-binding RTX toxin-like protein